MYVHGKNDTHFLGYHTSLTGKLEGAGSVSIQQALHQAVNAPRIIPALYDSLIRRKIKIADVI